MRGTQKDLTDDKNHQENTIECSEGGGSSADLRSLDASGIAEYIRFDCCPRYFKLRFEGDTEEKSRRWPEAFKPLSPLLYGAGRELETAKVVE
jgi:hypothetical protein